MGFCSCSTGEVRRWPAGYWYLGTWALGPISRFAIELIRFSKEELYPIRKVDLVAAFTHC